MRFLGSGGVGLVLLALAGVACSGADSEPASPVSMTTTTVPVTSTVPSVAADSMTATSTTAPMSDEDAVLAVFEAYMGFEFDEQTNGYGPSEELIERYSSGALKLRASDTLQARKDAEAFLVGRTSTRVESVTIDGDTAEVLACYLGGTEAFGPSGDAVYSDSGQPILTRIVIQRMVDGDWMLAEQFGGGAVPCEL